MAAKVARPCQRNDCPAPARAGIELSSMDKLAVLVDLPTERDPRRMELCSEHATRMSVPLGWKRADQRTEDHVDVPTGPPSVAEITALSTLEVLTAALEPIAASPDDAGVVAPGETGDEPSVATVIAAALANPVEDAESVADWGSDLDHGLVDDGTADVIDAGQAAAAADLADVVDVDEEIVEGGTQLVLVAAARLARRARPVPAALDD